MLQTIAQGFVYLFGIIIFLFCAWAMRAPGQLLGQVITVMRRPWGVPIAVGSRLLLGGALILAAPASRFPQIFDVLGWIALAAAVVLLLLGQQRMIRIVEWFAGMPDAAMRVWLVVGAGFGAFLVYGAS